MNGNRTFVRYIISTFLLGSLSVFTASALAANAHAGRQLTALLKHTHTMQATFSQKLYNGKGVLIRSSRGTMALQRPGRFRWNISSPSPQLMVATGKHVWIYDKALKQATVIVQKSGAGRTPAAILSSKLDLLTNYFRVQHMKKGWYYLWPRYGGTQFRMIQLRFHHGKLQRMWLFDTLGQKSSLRFTHVRVNRRLNQSLFNFRPPAGVDVITQRK